MRAWVLAVLAIAGCARPAPEDDQRWARYRQPDALIAALGVRAGERVADVGAGTGLLTVRLARAVAPNGRVTATDIDPAALEQLEARTNEMRSRVIARRVSPDDPGLEAASYDLILLSEVDHLLPDRVAYLRRLRAALAPRGRIAITNRRLYHDAALQAARDAGFTRTREVDAIRDHHILIIEGGE